MAAHPIYPRFLAHLSGDAAQPVTVQLLDPHSRRILHYLTLPEARGLLEELTRVVANADRAAITAAAGGSAVGAERPPASATASAMGPAKAAASGDLFRRRRG